MRLTRPGRAALALGLAALTLSAQQLAPQTSAPASPTRSGVPATVLRVTTRLVLVDVVVTDKQGQPVTDLTRDDFTLLENGKPQRIAMFSLENPGGAGVQQTAAPPPLPPNVYTNKPEYRLPPGPLTVLMLDALNTSMQDQAYAREQMLRYLHTQLQPNQRTAILALTTDLFLLQDFTADPALLIASLQKYNPQRTPRQASEGPLITPEVLAQIADLNPRLVSNLERFEEEFNAATTDQRVSVTLDALRVIARALAGYPGRKNLIWVSATFPFSLTPEDESNFLGVYRNYGDQIRRAASVLSDAQVAVYPLDARGLVGYPIGASEGFRGTTGRPFGGPDFGDQLTRRIGSLRDTHSTMQTLAEATGGRAYYNRNDIAGAVALSVNDGSTYYTLGFYPENKEWDGKFRRLQIKVAGKGTELRYRRGYYATDPTARPAPPKNKEPKSADEERDDALKAALMSGLPATLVTFRATVLSPAPAAPAEVEVRFLVDAPTVLFEEGSDGLRHASVDFLVAALAPDGKLAKAANDTLEANLTPENYALVQQQGVRYRMSVELPPGRYVLRLVVRDNRSGLMGSTDAPLLLQDPNKS